jgi:hypothetical protein
LKLLQEHIGQTLEDIGIGKDFLIRILIGQEIRARMEEIFCQLSISQGINGQNL